MHYHIGDLGVLFSKRPLDLVSECVALFDGRIGGDQDMEVCSHAGL